MILSTLLTPICVLVSWRSIDKHVKQFFAFLLLLEFGLVGVFCALDFFLFFVFWEVSLVPMYFLIGIWGHDRRIYSALKFFLYTMAGSALMLVAHHLSLQPGRHVRLHQDPGGTAERRDRAQLPRTIALFLAFFIAFAIKVPLVPAAHLAARRARGSAHRRLRDAGLRDAENGHLRSAAFLCAAVSERGPQRAPDGSSRWPSSASSMARWWRWCSPT